MPDRRIDSWEEPLAEDQRWQVYDRLRHYPWYQVATWAAEEFALAAAPSRSSLYRFRAHMRDQESEHRIETLIREKQSLRREMDRVGGISDELKAAYEHRAVEAEASGDHEGSQKWLKLALDLRESAIEGEKLALKREAEDRAKSSLALEREKFEEQKRRNAEAKAKLTDVVQDRAGGLDEETIRKIEEAAGLL
jgi:hypothetical protein